MAINIVEALSSIAKEDLAPGVMEMLPEVDPVWNLIPTSWEGVERSNMGRPGRNSNGDWVASTWIRRWIWKASGGGALKATNPSPNLVTEIGDQHNVWTSNAAFPGITDFVFGKFANPYIGLTEARGTLALPWQLLQADKLENVIVNMASTIISDAAELSAHSETLCFTSRRPSWGEIVRTPMMDCSSANIWYKTAQQTAAPCLLPEKDLDATASTNGVAFKQPSSRTSTTASVLETQDSISRLRPGMSVDLWEIFYDASENKLSITKIHDNGWVVDKVDYQQEEFFLYTKDDDTFSTGFGSSSTTAEGTSVASSDLIGYVITLKDYSNPDNAPTTATNATAIEALEQNTLALTDAIETAIDTDLTIASAYGPDGIASWMKYSLSDTLYGISMNNMPNARSFRHTMSSADFLTERLADRIMGWTTNQMGPRFSPDTLLTSNGVLSGWAHNQMYPRSGTYTETYQGQKDRGTPLSLSMGFKGVSYQYRGRNFNIVDSPLLQRRTAKFIKTRDKNIKRLVPPPIPGASGGYMQPAGVQFVAPLGGHKGVYMFAREASTAAVTDYLEAPFVMHYQHCAEHPQGVEIRNLKELDPWVDLPSS